MVVSVSLSVGPQGRMSRKLVKRSRTGSNRLEDPLRAANDPTASAIPQRPDVGHRQIETAADRFVRSTASLPSYPSVYQVKIFVGLERDFFNTKEH